MMIPNRSAFAALFLAAASAQAQNAAPLLPTPPPPPQLPAIAALPGLPGDDVLSFVSSEVGGRSVVKGAPYSATAVSETRQTLADGNRITRSSTARLYRDSQGRTRQEPRQGVVFINDVVAGKRLLLNTERKTARELPDVRPPAVPTPPAVPSVPGAAPVPPVPPTPPAPMSGEAARSWAEAMRQWGRDFSARMRAEAPVAVERDLIVRTDGDADVAAADIVNQRIEVVRLGTDGHAPMGFPPGPPMIVPRGPGATVALGSRQFDGVRADGTRTSWTIEAGKIGNEKPIEIVSERWYAPDLLLVVYSRHADPRTGERIYRLEGLKREEPAAELFRVPADFESKSRAAPRAEHK